MTRRRCKKYLSLKEKRQRNARSFAEFHLVPPVFHPPLIIIVDALALDLWDEDFVLAPVLYKQCQFMLNGGAAFENGPPLLRWDQKVPFAVKFWWSGRSSSIVVVLFVADVLQPDGEVLGGGLINFLIWDPEGLKSPEGTRTNKNIRVGVQKTHFIPISPWYLLAMLHKYGLDVVSTLSFCHWEQIRDQMRIDAVWCSQALWTGQNKSVHGY